MTAIGETITVRDGSSLPLGLKTKQPYIDSLKQAPNTALGQKTSPNYPRSKVPLGGNYADLIAIEDSARLAIIEVKLARTPKRVEQFSPRS